MSAGSGALRDVLLPAAAVCGALALGALTLGRLAGGVEHVGEWALRCLLAPLVVLDTAAHLGAAVAVGLVAFAAAAMTRVVVRQGAKAREVGRAVRSARLAALPPAVAQAAESARVSGRVDVVEARRPFAFAYGWLRPRICVSTALAERLSTTELQAALLHERWHVMRRDPVRLTAAAAVRSGLGFLPAFPAKVERYVVAVEIAADRFVVGEMGQARWLAGALLRLETGVAPRGFAARVEPRVAALVDGSLPQGGRRTCWATTALALEAAAAVALIVDPRLTAPLNFALLHAC